MLDIYVHNKVGINEDSYVCMSRTYGKPCAICEEQAELRKQDDFDEKYVKSLNPSRRVIYNISCLDSDTEFKKGIQIFEVSHWLFEKELAEQAKKPRGGGFVLFSDPDEGKTVFFRKTGNGPTTTKYSGFKFEDRAEPISDELLDSALCLDELIHIPSYDEVKNAFYGNDISEDIPEEEIVERRVEAEVTNRRPAKSQEPPPFKCPGTFCDDYGNFDACEKCPQLDDCEAAFQAAEEAANQPEPEPEPTPAPAAGRVLRRTSTEAAEPTAGRVARRSAPASEPEPEPEPESAPEASEGRRVRRRPGA
jgi:hypothetical protein